MESKYNIKVTANKMCSLICLFKEERSLCTVKYTKN